MRPHTWVKGAVARSTVCGMYISVKSNSTTSPAMTVRFTIIVDDSQETGTIFPVAGAVTPVVVVVVVGFLVVVFFVVVFFVVVRLVVVVGSVPGATTLTE